MALGRRADKSKLKREEVFDRWVTVHGEYAFDRIVRVSCQGIFLCQVEGN